MKIVEVRLDLAKDRVGKARDLGAAQGLDGIDSFVEDGVVRDAVKIKHLIDSDAQVLEGHGIDRIQATRRKTPEISVEQEQPSQDAIDDLGQECLITTVPSGF